LELFIKMTRRFGLKEEKNQLEAIVESAVNENKGIVIINGDGKEMHLLPDTYNKGSREIHGQYLRQVLTEKGTELVLVEGVYQLNQFTKAVIKVPADELNQLIKNSPVNMFYGKDISFGDGSTSGKCIFATNEYMILKTKNGALHVQYRGRPFLIKEEQKNKQGTLF